MTGLALNRPEAEFDLAAIRPFFANKHVLVTGAAGSIGSALSVTLARMSCAHLSMLDHFDHGLIEVAERVRRIAPKTQMTDILCDIRDSQRLEAWLSRASPDIVIHSAALKHVHLGERHPVECVLTNLVGTRNALLASAKAGVGHFMLVSTDKAAAPVCAMGASKRLAELYLAGFGLEDDSQMRIRAVRFGNVLGSQGSVLPRFQSQIAEGGPLEVTDPRMQRFFMSLNEAVGLILSVAALDDGPAASTYFMDMGQPSSILELGRDLIEQAQRDIDITFVGLRPGERLVEQLFDEHEEVTSTSLGGVYRVAPKVSEALLSSADVAHLEAQARTMDDAVFRQRLFAYLNARLRRSERAAG